MRWDWGIIIALAVIVSFVLGCGLGMFLGYAICAFDQKRKDWE